MDGTSERENEIMSELKPVSFKSWKHYIRVSSVEHKYRKVMQITNSYIRTNNLSLVLVIIWCRISQWFQAVLMKHFLLFFLSHSHRPSRAMILVLLLEKTLQMEDFHSNKMWTDHDTTYIYHSYPLDFRFNFKQCTKKSFGGFIVQSRFGKQHSYIQLGIETNSGCLTCKCASTIFTILELNFNNNGEKTEIQLSINIY